MGALDVIVTMPEWFRDGACAGGDVDPSAWDPPEDGGQGSHVPDAVKRVCAGCPIQAMCLDYALARPELDGTWGGTSRGQRQDIRRERRQPPIDGEPADEDPVPKGTRGTFTGVHGRYGPAGAAMHRRLGEPVCPLCRAADNAYTVDRKAALRARTGTDHPKRDADRDAYNEHRRMTRNKPRRTAVPA